MIGGTVPALQVSSTFDYIPLFPFGSFPFPFPFIRDQQLNLLAALIAQMFRFVCGPVILQSSGDQYVTLRILFFQIGRSGLYFIYLEVKCADVLFGY